MKKFSPIIYHGEVYRHEIGKVLLIPKHFQFRQMDESMNILY